MWTLMKAHPYLTALFIVVLMGGGVAGITALRRRRLNADPDRPIAPRAPRAPQAAEMPRATAASVDEDGLIARITASVTNAVEPKIAAVRNAVRERTPASADQVRTMQSDLDGLKTQLQALLLVMGGEALREERGDNGALSDAERLLAAAQPAA